MAIGSSGRIVIEIDPALKQDLYAALERDETNLKAWFLARVWDYLTRGPQLPLPLAPSEARSSVEALK